MTSCWDCSPELNPVPLPVIGPELPTFDLAPFINHLPATGGDYLLVGVLAAVLVLAGLLLALAVRRRDR